ncbi:hypothetical protein [Actinomadura sp. WMMB 499]|uniref:hypothetical protein n=1 Tax=Actinomadura sp. WMMB 499 TaxID=1219491 RepID=UPI00124421F5|nr:hypothetical protein [Actinomadura sp. WMMB 499]QFG24170.1 hypothetical protein F7P10_26645 [Actinomadura sp. WMMB 499]
MRQDARARDGGVVHQVAGDQHVHHHNHPEGAAPQVERIARSITDPFDRARALGAVAKAEMTDHQERAQALLDDAERIARSITDPYRRATVLGTVTDVVAGRAPERAQALLDEAERLTDSITDADLREQTLMFLARAAAGYAPAEAERIARSIPGPTCTWALKGVAAVVMETAPAEAERIARSITNPTARAPALGQVAGAVWELDPQHARALLAEAEHIARTLVPGFSRARALSEIAGAVAGHASYRARGLLTEAERITRSDTKTFQKWALPDVAENLAALDPAEAQRIVRSIADPYDRTKALGKVTETIAGFDPATAERIARSIRRQHIDRFVTKFFPNKWRVAQPLEFYGAQALAVVAGAVRNSDPQHALALLNEAERTARSITFIDDREEVLLHIVQAMTRQQPRKR